MFRATHSRHARYRRHARVTRTLAARVRSESASDVCRCKESSLNQIPVGARQSTQAPVQGPWSGFQHRCLEPRGYAEIVRQLAQLERLARTRFTVPNEMIVEVARAIRQAITLLSGGAVSGHWTDANLVLDDDGLAVISPNTVQLERH